MIRTRRVAVDRLARWLGETHAGPASTAYRLRVLTENLPHRPPILPELLAYVEEAHEDTKRKLRRVLAPSLSPFLSPPDPALGYPRDLHESSLMGYFGEVLAGLLLEHMTVHGHNSWRVPAFLFRFHQVAIQKLQLRRDLILQGLQVADVDDKSETIPGRTGNDVLAFREENGELGGIVACEAKCFSAHKLADARKAHKQLSASPRCPNGVYELIEILGEYDTPDANLWRERLRRFYLDDGAQLPSFNLLMYATGNPPKRNMTWLPSATADSSYTSSRPLEVLEVRLDNPNSLVLHIYRS